MADFLVPAPGPDPLANRAAFQATIDACEAAGGGTVRVVGRHLLAGDGPSLLVVRRALRIVGEGGGVSEVAVDAAVPAATDVLVYEPTDWTEGTFFSLRDLRVVPASGRPANRGVVLRPRPGSVVVRSVLVARCEIGPFGGPAVAVDNGPSATPNAVPGVFTSTVRDCRLTGGLDFTACADSVLLDACVVFGPGRVVVDLIAGAAMFAMRGCNVTCAGGVRVDGGHHVSIVGNYLELLAAATPDVSNGALLDLNGGTRVLFHPVVRDNTINSGLPGTGVVGVRLGGVRCAEVVGNDLFTEAAVPGVLVTAAALASQVRDNHPYGPGPAVVNAGDPSFSAASLGAVNVSAAGRVLRVGPNGEVAAAPPTALGPPAGQGQSAASLANKLRTALIAAGLGVP